MPRKKEKTQEEIETEFLGEIGMGDRLGKFFIWFRSLFDGGKTKICLATLHGRTEEVELLLFSQPELIEATWEWGPGVDMTLLHCAVIALRNREMTVELLLKKGFDARATDAEGLTAIDYALRIPRDHRSRRILTLLRNYGAF